MDHKVRLHEAEKSEDFRKAGNMNEQYNTIEEALEDLRAGKIILVTDDPDRENEGDMICAAEFATQENINFMACHAKGLICTPMSAAVAERLGLPQMVSENTDNHSTAFTVSIDHADTTTGISAAERSCVSVGCKARRRPCEKRAHGGDGGSHASGGTVRMRRVL